VEVVLQVRLALTQPVTEIQIVTETQIVIENQILIQVVSLRVHQSLEHGIVLMDLNGQPMSHGAGFDDAT
jgi:hypothetical protein